MAVPPLVAGANQEIWAVPTSLATTETDVGASGSASGVKSAEETLFLPRPDAFLATTVKL